MDLIFVLNRVGWITSDFFNSMFAKLETIKSNLVRLSTISENLSIPNTSH